MIRALGVMMLLAVAGCGVAPRECNARTCSGCCSASGECVSGSASTACGSLGASCRDCTQSNLVCSVGSCQSLVGPIGNGPGNFGGGAANLGGGTASVGGGVAVGGGTATAGGAASAGGGASSPCSMTATCDVNATCSVVLGAAQCTCRPGFSGNGFSCTDLDECQSNNGGCDPNAQCTNTAGSRTCTCFNGYTGEGLSCTDVNECLANNGGCAANATCSNLPGSRSCTCPSGSSGNGVTCSDVNECLTNNGGCDVNATCLDTTGARVCTCRAGFTGDGVTCADVNECLTSNGGCSVNATCTNTFGARLCSCRTGYTGDGLTCTASAPTWTLETVAFSGGSNSSIALDSAGLPAIAYFSDSPRGVYLRRRTTVWHSAETIDSATNAMEPALAASNTFVVVNSVSTLVGSSISSTIATWRRAASTTAWSAESALSGYERPDLAVGGGREHLVAVVRSGASFGQVGYASRLQGSTSWSFPTVLGTGSSGFGPRVSASGSMVVVLFSRSPEGLTLARSSNNGSTWTSTTVTAGRAWDWDVVLDPSGTVFLVYYTPDSGHRVILESYSGLTRTQQTIIDTPQGTNSGSMWFSGLSIAQSPVGTTHAAWLDFTRGNVLRYASNADSASFQTSTVGPADDVLGETSIAVDASLAVHISYPAPAASFGNLGYAVRR